MTNIFDINNYPHEIGTLVCGDFWGFKNPVGDYGGDYTLSYTLTPLTGGTIISIPSNLVDGYYVFEVSATTTATYTPNTYRYTVIVTRTVDGSRGTIKSGIVNLLPNPATNTGDSRSHVRKTLDAIRATIEGRASTDQMAMSINGRSISRTPMADLLALEIRYATLLQREEKEEAIKNGVSRNNRQILVRMS